MKVCTLVCKFFFIVTYNDADSLCLGSTEPGAPPIAQLIPIFKQKESIVPCDS